MKNAARVLALALVLVAAACNGIGPIDLGPSVSGTVVDATTLAPIDGATITIAGRQGASRFNGSYFIAEIPRGTQTLKATKDGYATFTEEVTIEDGLVQKTIKLTK
jgi:hypothetical protein